MSLYKTYRVTKDLSLGQIRRVFQVGETIEFNGSMTRINGVEHRISTIDLIINNKWLVPVYEETAITIAAPQLPAVVIEKPVEKTEPLVRIPFASKEAKEADGVRPVANKPHVWSGGGVGDWLNSEDGPVCKVCGVTKLTNLIRADRTRGDGKQQHLYRDATGNLLTSLEELSCPTYIGDPGSAAALAKEHVRRVRGRVDEIDGKLETVDDRLTRLEEDNEFLRQRLIDQPVLNAEMVAEALLIIASKANAAPKIAERIRMLLLPTIEKEEILSPLLEPELVKSET